VVVALDEPFVVVAVDELGDGGAEGGGVASAEGGGV
jgi:hypothetical protein